MKPAWKHCLACGFFIMDGEADSTNEWFHRVCMDPDLDATIEQRAQIILDTRARKAATR